MLVSNLRFAQQVYIAANLKLVTADFTAYRQLVLDYLVQYPALAKIIIEDIKRLKDTMVGNAVSLYEELMVLYPHYSKFIFAQHCGALIEANRASDALSMMTEYESTHDLDPITRALKLNILLALDYEKYDQEIRTLLLEIEGDINA